jgi:hypothetical protein
VRERERVKVHMCVSVTCDVVLDLQSRPGEFGASLKPVRQ